MGKIKEVPSKIYVNALSLAGIPTTSVININVRRQEKQGDVEYTLINSIWRKPSEIPEKFPVDICIYYSYRIKGELRYAVDSMPFASEKEFLDEFGNNSHSIAWCYFNDILPKGGLK